MNDVILEPEAPQPPKGPRLILGSASPRRRELLAQIGLEPDGIEAPNIDETPGPKEKPRPYAQRMARQKAEALEAHHVGDFIITGDTVVARGTHILPKAERLDQAENMPGNAFRAFPLGLFRAHRHYIHRTNY